MAQASPTLCGHDAPGQTVRGDVDVTCRKCGAQIKATPRAVQSNALIASEKQVNAAYPGDSNTTDRNWAFSQ